MLLETTQLLCTTAHIRGINDVPYKPTHKNHPARIWVGESSANWNWLCHHGLGIAREYTSRYGKIHKCQVYVQNLLDRTLEIWNDNLPYENHTPFVQCMPELYKSDNAVISYRNYFCGEKQHLAQWKAPSMQPNWFIKN